MPYRPRNPCRAPGCPNLCDKGVYCAEHAHLSAERQRETAERRGYDSKWRKARKAYLRRNPLCVECMREGRLTPATVIDHIIPHRGDERLFWNQGNWQPLCQSCHNRKTGNGL